MTIEVGEGPTFHISAPSWSYILRVTRHGHLEHVYWGAPVTLQDADALAIKTDSGSYYTAYTPDDPDYGLDIMALEYSGLGKGDYREPGIEARMADGSFTTDFRYVSHEILQGVQPPAQLPSAHVHTDPAHTAPGTSETSEHTGANLQAQTLKITLLDADAQLTLHYTVHPCCNVLTRRATLSNQAQTTVGLRRLMSSLVDIPNRQFDLVTFDGNWAAEGHMHKRPVAPGTYINSSLTGFSSNRHNPGVILESKSEAYGFNLIYSGNHATYVQLTNRNLVRVASGINPVGFDWELNPGEDFETPEAVLTYANGSNDSNADASNQVTENLHDFVNHHIVPEQWDGTERPVLVNTWESAGFNVTEKEVLRQARAGARLGAELVVLDDGWFIGRNDDHGGLGDYTVDSRKFPHGLGWLSQKVREAGVGFGIWVEPEMVNRRSRLYQAHPDWAIAQPGRVPSEHRNQLVLDLTREDVRDYIVEQVGRIIDESQADYVKWDCNRNLTDLRSGALGHGFILGLYDVLRRIFGPRPHVLLETCASGGNRFDLGMLCFGPQIWTSDCTDPVERIAIQGGLARIYPQSTMGAHVADSPSQQNLRASTLATRFNVAAFGVLGYEFDLTTLNPSERHEVREQISWYKRHRKLLQFGSLSQRETWDAHHVWQISGTDLPPQKLRTHKRASIPRQVKHIVAIARRHGMDVPAQPAVKGPVIAVVGHFQTTTRSAQPPTPLPIASLDAQRRYAVTSRPQGLELAQFGHLLRFVLPKWLKYDGLPMKAVNAFYRLPDAPEHYEGTGAALRNLAITGQFEGSLNIKTVRIWGESGSTLYEVSAL